MGFMGVRFSGVEEMWNMWIPEEYKSSLVTAGKVWLFGFWTLGACMLVHKVYFSTAEPKPKKKKKMLKSS